MMQKFIMTRVDQAQALQGVVRVPAEHMNGLGLYAGDTVLLEGHRTTVARAMPHARDTTAVMCSDAIANNTGSTFGDDVTLRPANLTPITSVTVKILGDAYCSSDDLNEALFDLPLAQGDRLQAQLPLGRTATIEVVDLAPAPMGLFQSATVLSLVNDRNNEVQYDGVGGLKTQIARVHEMVALPLLRPELFAHLGLAPPRGVLFTGPPGSGKTLLARAIAAQTSANFFQISGPEIVSKHYGDSEAALRRVFQNAEKQAPAIVFIDEIDAIAPRRETLSGEKQVERRIVAQLLTLLDGLADRGQVVVMAATNLPDSLDPALRRPGRFDREIPFLPPSASDRRAILEVHLRDAPLGGDVDLPRIADQCHGYVGADLAALAREAALAALDRVIARHGADQAIEVEALFITQRDLEAGFAATSPSILRDTFVETPVVDFGDIGGLHETKETLTQAVIWPQVHGELFKSLHVQSTSGVLMCGPPGSGKTLLARALATESGMNFIPVRPGRIMSQFLGDAERAIVEVFAKARQSAPCLIFFDELDALAPRRTRQDALLGRVVAQLLMELDGLASNADIVVLAATNRAAAIDPALTRPGRFDTVISIPLPNASERLAILQVHCRSLPLAADVDLALIARKTKGASGAELCVLSQAAARLALARNIKSKGPEVDIKQEDFLASWAHLQKEQVNRDTDFITQGGLQNARI